MSSPKLSKAITCLLYTSGLATLEEIDRAVDVVRKSGIEDLTLLHCESRYPADPEKFNLNSIPYLKERYQCRSGLSNHAIGDELDIAATALGADMIEKHFTDDKMCIRDRSYTTALLLKL